MNKSLSPAAQLDRTLENLHSLANRGNPWAERLARIKTRELMMAHSSAPEVVTEARASVPAPRLAITVVRPA